ncbi:MAG: metalloregulator ArsR/SmtB family transcription factor [Pseudomonadota bacterium]|jgi:DNA-binding transcriptional ArsR family regulator|nr:MAG: transcriptional regulator [Pseudomonadota bacterium]
MAPAAPVRSSTDSRRRAARIAPDLGRSAAEAARLLRVLSNQNRLLLVCLLIGGEKTVGELNRALPLSQSALSQHLAVLREEGLVRARRAGQNVHYGLASAPARRIVETLHALFCRR